MSVSTSAVNILIGHLQNDVILLQRLESLRGLVSCANKGFCYLNPGGGGGYSHSLPIRVCAAQRGRAFEAPDLERGIHFRGVF